MVAKWPYEWSNNGLRTLKIWGGGTMSTGYNPPGTAEMPYARPAIQHPLWNVNEDRRGEQYKPRARTHGSIHALKGCVALTTDDFPACPKGFPPTAVHCQGEGSAVHTCQHPPNWQPNRLHAKDLKRHRARGSQKEDHQNLKGSQVGPVLTLAVRTACTHTKGIA